MTRLHRRPGRQTRRRTCFRCRFADSPELGLRVHHFNLAHQGWTAPDNPKPRMRGAGSIDLCERCWRMAVAESRIRRGKPHRDRQP